METTYLSGVCPLSQISWLWYAVSVIAVFGVGMLWYSVLFGKKWAAAVRYECACGADLAEGEKCACKPNASMWFTFILQFIATALVGLMYFILTDVSVWLSVIVVVAVCGWMKTTLRFEIADCRRWMTLCGINVGYFFVASVIFVLFSLI